MTKRPSMSSWGAVPPYFDGTQVTAAPWGSDRGCHVAAGGSRRRPRTRRTV